MLAHIRRAEVLKPGDRVGVAVSGGIDSVALLRLLLKLRNELGIVLSVVHFNHKLRGTESDGDQEFVAALAREHELEFFCDSDDVTGHAAAEHVSLEAAARELRYGFFEHLITNSNSPARLGKIVTGHTLDDQAETVLMRMIRGSGSRGLSAIYPRIEIENDDDGAGGEIVRPLLGIRHRDLEQYLNEIGQIWREDSSNAEDHFTRNRVRKLLVPLLEKEFNPSVAENLAELAEIARGEEDYWENEVAGWMGTAVHWSQPEWAQAAAQPGLVQITASGASEDSQLQSAIANATWAVMNASVDLLWFLGEPLAVQRRLVKAIGEEAGIPLEFKHVDEVLHLAHGDARKESSLPLGWTVRVESDALWFVTPDLRSAREPGDYEYELSIPGQIAIGEIGSLIEVIRVSTDGIPAYNPDNLLDADSLSGSLCVRNWRPGDRFWPAHTKAPRKVKELLQERHLPQPERKLWPVVVHGNEIVWMRGFPCAANLRPRPGHEAIAVVESPVDSK